MRLLIIDDEPTRAQAYVNAGHVVHIAHTFAQIEFWLKNGPWDQIMLDHDMGIIRGVDYCRPDSFGPDIVGFGCPIRIWSLNADGAREMHILLKESGQSLGIRPKITRERFGTVPEDLTT